MNIKQLFSMSALLVCTSVAFADDVSPETVSTFPEGTVFSGLAAGKFNHNGEAIPSSENTAVSLTKTATGFTYTHTPAGRSGGEQKVTFESSKVGRAGARGNATIGGKLIHGQPIRFEWVTNDIIKYEYWYNEEAMRGQTGNKPGTAAAYLVRQK